MTKLPIVLKGIVTAEDAKLAVQHGVDGIIVSIHGGRELDTVSAPVSLQRFKNQGAFLGLMIVKGVTRILNFRFKFFQRSLQQWTINVRCI